MHYLTSCPALRLVIPLIAGVVLSGVVGDSGLSVWCALTLLCASALPLLPCIVSDYGPHRLYGPLIFCFFLSTGFVLSSYERGSVEVEWPERRLIYKAVVYDQPADKARSRLIPLRLMDTDNGEGLKVWLYVPKTSASAMVEPGDVMMFNGLVKSPDNEGLDFDYAAYLYRKGVSGTLWVDSLHWRAIGSKTGTPLRYRRLALRSFLLDKYVEWGLQGETLAVVSAVSLGNKELLDDDIRQTYSASGASHVLAVSGLHVGIMYMFLSFLFPAFMNVSWRRWLKEGTVILILWCYAYMIGMPVSITRSLIMFSLMALCRCSGRESSSVNSLAMAAIIIVLASPSSAYDVGFQLSFLAVFSILLFQPMLSRLWQPSGMVLCYFRDIITVSIAAQIGTAPAVMYHFSSFSSYFLITNLFVIPMMFATVCLTMALLAVSWIPVARSLLVNFLSFLVSTMDSCLEHIVSMPYSSVKTNVGTPLSVMVVYAVIFLLYIYISRRKPHLLVAAIGIAVLAYML